MFQKLLSVVLIVLMALIGIISPNSSYAQDKDEYNIAVLDLDANGISETEAKSLSNNMRVQITRVVNSEKFIKSSDFRYTVVERSQMDKIFEQFEIQNTGCTDISCAIEFGKMLNVERIIIGSVGLVGETYTINASIVDIETSKTLQVADYRFKGARDNLLNEGIPDVVNQLLGIKKKSRKKLYIIAGIVILGGAVAASLGGGTSDEGDKSSDTIPLTGTISIIIPDPSE